MPPLAALGAAAMAAASTVTIAGLAQAAAVISMGTGVLSQITGSKILGKISMGFGIASGVGSLYSMGAASMRGAALAGGKGLMAANSIEDMLNTPTKGTRAAQAEGLKTFGTKGGQTSSMDRFREGSRSIGSGTGKGIYSNNAAGNKGAFAGGAEGTPPGGFDPELGGSAGGFDPDLEKSFFERTNNTLTKYNSLVNVAAGIGQGYMQGQQMDQKERFFDKRLAQDQQLIDRNIRNSSTLSNFDPTINLSRRANPFPLLQRN